MYLNVHSSHSLRYGTFKMDELPALAASYGISRMALTDINNTSAAFDFITGCKEYDIHPVAGMEFRNGNKLLYVALARNHSGFQQMNEFLSFHNLSSLPLPEQPFFMEDAFIIYPYGNKKPESLLENEYLGIGPADLNNIQLRNLRDFKKIVILHPATFKDREGYALHLHLRAIDNNVLLSRLTRECAGDASHCLLPADAFRRMYKDFPQAIHNTDALLEGCTSDFFDYKEMKNKKTLTGSVYEDRMLLENLIREGVALRYGEDNRIVNERVAKELDIISAMNFIGYFLITWDMVRYSMSRGFYHVGRGSGANSIIAYCLRITDVDPIELDLYFERFLNPKRLAPPDFDIDYSWKDRNEMFDYLFRKHGSKHVALLGNMPTFKRNSIVRELGKVYGLPKSEIDLLADHPEAVSGRKITDRILKYGTLMKDFPNMRSIHAGGVMISEKPIACYAALDLPPKGYPTVQWDMYVAESIAFEKLDVLSQRGIGHIRDCVEIVQKNRGIRIDVHDIPTFKNDPQVKAQLKKGDTIGCFYVESPAMRQLLKKLHCDNYRHLVAASSIIRPGVAGSGMMGQFIHRFHHQDEFHYLHPVMEEQLHETFGIMVYQEDVMKVCHHYAGLDLADADVLRRLMSGKHREKDAFKNMEKRFFDGALALGRDPETTREIWRQTCSFGGFSFCKAHSASFAVESFQSLYLKSYFPLEFMVAVINNFGGFYTFWVYVKEAIKSGAKLNLPCINRSESLTSIYGDEIYIGFGHVQHLEAEFAGHIETERKENGIYRDMGDFVRRTGIAREQLFTLIRLGALRDFGKKKALMWEATLHISKESRKATAPQSTAALFEPVKKHFCLPVLEESLLEDAYDEIELLGFPLSLSEFDMLQTTYRGNVQTEDLVLQEGKKVRLTGNLVTTKDVRGKDGRTLKFGTFMDERHRFFDSVHFGHSLSAYPFTGKGVYLMEGKVICDFGVPSIEVEKLARLPFRVDPRG